MQQEERVTCKNEFQEDIMCQNIKHWPEVFGSFFSFHFEIQMDSIYSSVKVSVLDWVFSLSKKKKNLCLAIPRLTPGASPFNTFIKGSLLSQLPCDLKPLQGPGKVPGGLHPSFTSEIREAESVVLELRSFLSAGYTWASVRWSKTQEPVLQAHTPCLHNGLFWLEDQDAPGDNGLYQFCECVFSKLFIQVCFLMV